MTQKFETGDLVRVGRNPKHSGRDHFPSDFDAIVLGSYDDLYGGGNDKEYSLYRRYKGEVAWYYEDELTLIKENQIKLLREWRTETKGKRRDDET